jgi:uncharacterized protein (TIGR03118 family)
MKAVSFIRRSTLLAPIVLCVSLMPAFPRPAAAQFVQVNLVSDGFVPAVTIDPLLKNPWGISFGPNTPFWVSNQVTGTATLYNGAGAKVPINVNVQTSPTGQVFNGSADFVVTSGGASGPARFIFAGLDGRITGWNPAVPPPPPAANAIIGVTTPGAVYTGLAIGNNGAGNFLYAANHAGGIDVFNGTWTPTALAGSFTDPTLPAGMTPFNAQNLGGLIYVTYSTGLSDLGGAVSVFDTNGNFIRRIATDGPLNAPWGVAFAPSIFGAFSNALLVGNFGDGRISAFDAATDAFLGQLTDINGNPIVNEDLWAVMNGTTNGLTAAGAVPNNIYFAAGIGDEQHGLFGRILAVPEPSPLALLVCGAIPAAMIYCRRRR